MFEPVVRGSGQPILEPQTGDLLEVFAVRREQQRVVNENDGCDLQVHAADAHPRRLPPRELIGRAVVKGKYGPRSKKLEQASEPGIRVDLTVYLPFPRD